VIFYLSGPIDAALKAELNHVPENARLFMPGRVSLETNLAHVKSCSFGISPTLIENFSMAILEAGFCGVPMVTFAVGGVAELVKHGETGLLVPLLDVEGLVGSAVSLLDAGCCDGLRRTTGAATRARFAPEQVALQYLALFERCLEQGR
jgi:glycosyltransferase involved in cell wall biosynthesis